MLGKPSTSSDSDFASVLTSTDCSSPEVFVHVALSTENSVGEFTMVILKYREWYLCQISRTNHAIICLYYYPQKVCNFHM